MTIASAASLPRPGSEAPFRHFELLRRNDRWLDRHLSLAASTPRSHLPHVAPGEDPPLGRILIVAEQAPVVFEIQGVLRDAGYRPVGPAESASDVQLLAAHRPIDGAVVDLDLGTDKSEAVFQALLRQGVPSVALREGTTEGLPDMVLADGCRVPTVSKSDVSRNLIRALEQVLSSDRKGRNGGHYPVTPPQSVWPRVFPQL
jgi:hypothetical protein